ncbi:hypothetical protein PR048_023736 [Dryococelus australis]|uniref:Uncharacterized protein n=1 Tax=Dryococelus australis TaxID=614101 RepID=A0ABQ9GUY3_9NEOP|nr:hypothetical protein PR048_023736 [Dryococelus australis]
MDNCKKLDELMFSSTRVTIRNHVAILVLCSMSMTTHYVIWSSSKAASLLLQRSSGDVVARLLAFHIGEPGSIPGGVAPGFLHVGIVPDDAAGRWSLLFPPPLHSGTAPHSPHFTLIGSEDLDVKSRPSFSTPLLWLGRGGAWFQDGLGKLSQGGKAHKTPWGKVKDIIQTRKDSLKRRHHRSKDDDAYGCVDLDPPSSPGDEPLHDVIQGAVARPARQSVGEGGGRRQQCKISTCSLGSHPLALEPPPASRRLTPTLTITLPSTEELRAATMAADASPQPEERCHKTSTSAPGTAEDGPVATTSSSSSESNRRQVNIASSWK